MENLSEFGSAHEIADAIARRQFTCMDVVDYFLHEIDEKNPSTKAYTQVLHESARMLATQRDDELRAGLRRGPLHGVPITVKDCLDLEGVPTTQGSKHFGRHPAEESATVVRRLLAAGAIPMAKGNLPEFTLGYNTVSDVGGQTRNPWDPQRSPGGSSGGEAAGVAAGMAPLGIGTDVGGSVRFPAHCCGVVGFKPSARSLPLDGAWPDVLDEFNCIGTLSRSVADAQIGYRVMAGTWSESEDPNGRGHRRLAGDDPGSRASGLRIGFVTGGGLGPVDAQTRKAISELISHLDAGGFHAQPVDLDALGPLYDDTTFGGLCVVEIKQYLHRNRVDDSELSELTRARLDAESDSVYPYLDARDNLKKIRRVLREAFSPIDVLVCPVSPTVAPVLGEAELSIDGERWPVRRCISLAGLFSLGGNPAMSVPYRYTERGMPIGIQIVAPRGHEDDVFAVAGVVESLRGETLRRPPLPFDEGQRTAQLAQSGNAAEAKHGGVST
jgi:aspartyl-tRNA(Asn)/glutamyl-tRNA(Gln) amidotransferase subunit A